MSQLPNTSINSPYGLEQYFKDTPSSPIVAEQIDKIKPNKFIDSPGSSDPQEPAYSSTTWKVTAINNIFSTLPHTLRNSSTCYEGYNCGIEAGICYGTGTQIGSYTGPDAQTDCESNCSPITFNCNNGVCVNPGDGTGTYTYTTATANGFTGAQEECEGWGLSATGQPFSGTSLPIGYNVLSPAFLSALTSGITAQNLLDYFNNLDLKDEYGEPNCGPSIGIDNEGCQKDVYKIFTIIMIHAMVIVVVHIVQLQDQFYNMINPVVHFLLILVVLQLVLEPKQVALLVLQVKLQLLWKTKLLKE
jgi:hypothetical protein